MDGPFYFAWSSADERTFGVEHMRMDEDVFDFTITHSEGDFASLTVTVRNPRVGLLASGRPVWAWFAYNKNFNPAAEPVLSDVVPLIFGRLVGMPENLDGETVSLQFIARPEDFAEQKEAVAEALKVRPYWDPIWFNPDNLADPDNVLESRPALWHVDPTTHEVTTSDITNGEDGVVKFDEDNVFYDSVSVTYEGSPLRTVNVTASVSWDQKATGEVALDEYLGHGAYHSIVTYTGDQLIANWPKEGASFGGGWKVGSRTSIQRVDRGKAQWMFTDMLEHIRPFEGKSLWCPSWCVPHSDRYFQYVGKLLKVPKQTLVGQLSAAFNVSRNKSETLTFSLTADVQSVVTEPEDNAALDLAFSSAEVTSPIDPDGALPIGDVAHRAYFPTERGTQSIEYLVALARSKLIASARCVRLVFEVPFIEAISAGLSLRKSGVLTDARMPGGVAAGKIVEFQLSGDGSSGEFKASLTLASSVGKGGSVESVDGTPTYVEDGYVDHGFQRYEGQYVLPDAGDVGYLSIEGQECVDDDFDFERLTPGRIVKSVTKTNLVGEQNALIPDAADRPEDVFAIVNSVPCTFEIELHPVISGPFFTAFETVCTELKIPKTIDLEADVVSS